MNGIDLKRTFLVVLIASVAVSAVTGIGVMLFGDFGGFEIRVLMTTLTVTVASILGLACGACLESGKGRLLPIAGIALSIVSALALFLIVWNALDDNETFIKSTLTLVIFAVVCSHLSLLSLANLDRRFAWTRLVAFLSDWLLAAIILYIIWLEPESSGDLVFRIIAVLSILIAAVTVITPAFHKLSAAETGIAAIDTEIEKLRARIEELERRRENIEISSR
jgi:hypothetical protein